MGIKNIRLEGVRQNNLKGIHVEFPHKQLSVVTGVSGSGKSSLAFDTLYAEGQRRYVESLSTYTRQFLEKMPKPELDHIENIPPAIALEQKNSVVNSRSTVGTQTEIDDYLRILFSKVGKTICPDCGIEVKKQDTESVLVWAKKWLPKRKALIITEIQPPKAPPQKTGKKKAAPTQSATFLNSYWHILREKGFTRFVWKKNLKNLELFSLEDLGTEEFPKITWEHFENGQIYLLVDRMKIDEWDSDTQSRVSDSTEQAKALGRGTVHFVDAETKEWKTFDNRYACGECGREFRPPEPMLFSFNSPLGACRHCSGFGYTLDVDEGLVVPDPTKTLKNGAIDPLSKPSASDSQSEMFRFAERHGISIGKRYSELSAAQKKLLWEGDPKDKLFKGGIVGFFEELKQWKYKLYVRVFIRRYQTQTLCRVCNGMRLTPDALAVKINGKNLPETQHEPIENLIPWFKSLKLTAGEKKIVSEVFSQIQRRLEILDRVGVGYLTLARLARSLSGGEFQRINLATQLGNGLCGTLYVLDEPSIGLHAADTDRLIDVLKELRDQGNTLVVVEHDLEVMRAADWLVELGPQAGYRGGELIAQGTAALLEKQEQSITGKYLSGALQIEPRKNKRSVHSRTIKVTGCSENNLQSINADFPLERMVVVTGVSGSGKSTLVHKTLYAELSRLFERNTDPVGQFERIYGVDQIHGVVLLDQSPIGKSSRSNPATYMKIWDEVRRVYSNQVLSLRRGYTPQFFSFNVDGGRCPVCKGEGEIVLDMHFMAEVKIPCEECQGKRFKKNVLEVTYRGKNVDDLLNSTVDEAFELFRENAILYRKLSLLREVGLGYLRLGQSGSTLSGGESQRLKIAGVLDDRSGSNLLYILDEPTTGLHLEDIRKLLHVLQDLVDERHSVIMIEHHLDVIRQADWVIDLGPGGGARGGKIVATGTPEQLMENPASITGKMLLKHLGLKRSDLLPGRDRSLGPEPKSPN